MHTYKKFTALFTAVAMSLATFTSALFAETTFQQTKAPVVAVVDFKTCVEKSKMGLQEQASFDALKKQMEKILADKEKALTDLAKKSEDQDYVDSLSPDALKKFKEEGEAQFREFSQIQQQFYQTLSQTNLAVIQKLNDAVTKAAEQVAKNMNIDLVLNKEGCFYCSSALDISTPVVAALDEAFAKEGGADKAKAPAGLVQ